MTNIAQIGGLAAVNEKALNNPLALDTFQNNSADLDPAHIQKQLRTDLP
jgi:hypothetical protein